MYISLREDGIGADDGENVKGTSLCQWNYTISLAEDDVDLQCYALTLAGTYVFSKEMTLNVSG